MAYRGNRIKTEEVELFFHGSTENAIRVSEFDVSEQVWLPRSQIRIVGNMRQDADGNDIITLVAPEWLLTEKGLV